MKHYPLFLAVDIGTTATRSVIFNERGEVQAQYLEELDIHQPRPGYAEENPEELWRKTLRAIKKSVHLSKCRPDEVAVISLSAQMHGLSAMDKKGNVLLNLLTWFDLRAGRQSEKLEEEDYSCELYQRTGCPPLFVYPLAKILWIKETKKSLFRRVHRFLSAKDYVLYRLLGEPYLDHSTASGSQLMNIHNLTWDTKVLDWAGINEDNLPVLCSETDVLGELSGPLARRTGLKRGTPIIAGASDAALSNIGLGAVRAGIGAVNLGSSGAIRAISRRPRIDESEEMRFFCYYAGLGRWLPGGAINNAGLLLRWFRDSFGHFERKQSEKRGVSPYQIMDEEAMKVPPGSERLIMIPFLTGERFPIRDYRARGTIFGLSYEHGRAHLIRAMMESTAFTLKSIMDALEEQRVDVNEIRVSGGGAKSNVWRQILADVLGRPVMRTKVEEASALGAAILATISLGVYKDLEGSVARMVRTLRRHRPNHDALKSYSKLYEIYRELYPTLRPYYEKLAFL